jgi:hypothetical protein
VLSIQKQVDAEWWFLVGRGKGEACAFFVATKNIEALPKSSALPLEWFTASAGQTGILFVSLKK